MRIHRRAWLTSLAAATGSVLIERLFAQPPRPPVQTSRVSDDRIGDAAETEVSLVLVTSAAAAIEHAQAWGQRLQSLEIPVQTRQAVTGDKPEVKEQKLGRFRRITVTAVLDRNGKILCGDRSFTFAEAEKLGEWIRELKTYGAQGAPHGKPLFGLNDAQFAAVMKSLAPVIEMETSGLSLEEMLGKLPLPRQHPLRMTAEAQRVARMIGSDEVLRQNLKGISVGAAFAAALGEFGLAFKPLRTPEGNIELAILPRDHGDDAWPIGWPLDHEKPQGQLVPALFKTVPINLEDVPLTDALNAAADASKVVIVIDRFAIQRAGIDLSELKVTISPRKTTWGLLLKQMTFPHKLGRKLVADESGKPFVVITTLQESTKQPVPTPQ
jgi:hypothetical protein